MSRELYSDPFLRALLDQEPKLAQVFLETIANSDFAGQEEVVSCNDVPGWVLEKIGRFAYKNPNFPIDVFEYSLKDEAFVSENIWSIINSPLVNQGHVNQLMQSDNNLVRELAFTHPLGDSSKLLEYLKEKLANGTFRSYALKDLYEKALLTDEIFDVFINAPDHDGIVKKLWKNESLTLEQRALLVLAEIQPEVAEESLKDFWESRKLFFISSIPYCQMFNSTFDHDGNAYTFRPFATIPTIDQSIEAFFSKIGHPLSVVLPHSIESEIQVTISGLQELITLELLHRLFWTELCGRDDFGIYRRNAEETDDVFISHSILGREFQEAEAEHATRLGGVFGFHDQKWLISEEELYAEEAAYELSSSCDESLLQSLEWGEYERLGQTLIALTFIQDDLPEKYGFELTEDAEDWMIEAAKEIADIGSFDVSAEINPNFGEILSWRDLPDTKKEKILEFLIYGFNYKDSKLRNDSIHFLGCMALHEDTPKSILEKLAKLDDPLVNEVLTSRG